MAGLLLALSGRLLAGKAALLQRPLDDVLFWRPGRAVQSVTGAGFLRAAARVARALFVEQARAARRKGGEKALAALLPGGGGGECRPAVGQLRRRQDPGRAGRHGRRRVAGDLLGQRLAAAAERHPNAVLVDWYAASKDHPEYFVSDGIHLTAKGARAYAKLIKETGISLE